MAERNCARLKELAQYLLSHETFSDNSVAADGAATFRVCGKLRVALSKLMGATGYRSLLSRAVALAGRKIPWLRGVHVQADGTLEDSTELKSQLDNKQISLGEVALVAELLGLMVTFIGPALTIQLLQQTWPKADFSKAEF